MDLVEHLRQEAGEIEKIDLMDLVTHNDFVNGEVRLDQVYEMFKENQHDYMAVIDEGMLLGLCSRTDIGFVLGSRFGFAVMGKKPIREHIMGSPVCMIRGHSIRDSLVRVLTRSDKRFYEDVVLADADGSYLGIIPVPYLVHLQTGLMQEKYLQMEQNILDLESSKQQNAQLFENQAIGIVFLDPTGVILKANQKMGEMLGLSSLDQFREKIFSNWIVESDRGRYGRYFEETLKHEGDFFLQSQEFEFLCENKSSCFFRVQFGHIHLYRDPCLFVFDVTEQHEMEKALVSREKTAAVESLVCGIAHELNNKLSPIMGMSELILLDCKKNPEENSEFMNRVQMIHDTSKEAGIMIRQLQQLSHPTSSKFEICDLTEILESVLKMMRHHLAQNEIFNRFDFPKEQIKIQVDLSQIKQVFLNLMMNAVQAMRNRTQKNLNIQVLPQGQKVAIRFEDSREGIPEAILDKIFEPFFTTKQAFEGIGLGLSVCQNLVQNHEGTLSVNSEPGVGSVFTVILPRLIHSDPSLEPPIESEKISEKLLRHGNMEFLQGKKILIVDDESDICQMIVSAFKGMPDIVVMSAYSQEKAIDLLKMYRFDWVVSDLRMPFYSGIDLYDWICSNQVYLKEKFLLITGESELSSLSKSVEELKIPIIRKPFSITKLIQAMESFTALEAR